MKKLLFFLLHAAGLTRFAAWWNRKRIIFVCYHGVTQRQTRSPDDPTGLHVNQRRFAVHLDFLGRRYYVISLYDYLAANLERRSLPEYSVVLTFDDGFRNFLTAAAPLLAARSFPATVFLITDKTGDEKTINPIRKWSPEDDSRYLSWAEAQLLKREQGIEFGSHTCSHSRLLTLSPAEAERELLDSYNKLVAVLGVAAPALSYPKGEYSSLLAEEAQKLGYACAVTTDRGTNELDHDLFTLGRTLIGDDDDEASFAVRVSGLRWWLVRMRALLVRPSLGKPQTAAIPVSPGTSTPKMFDEQSMTTET